MSPVHPRIYTHGNVCNMRYDAIDTRTFNNIRCTISVAVVADELVDVLFEGTTSSRLSARAL